MILSHTILEAVELTLVWHVLLLLVICYLLLIELGQLYTSRKQTNASTPTYTHSDYQVLRTAVQDVKNDWCVSKEEAASLYPRLQASKCILHQLPNGSKGEVRAYLIVTE